MSPHILYGFNLLLSSAGVLFALLLLHSYGGVNALLGVISLAIAAWCCFAILVKKGRVISILIGGILLITLMKGGSSFEWAYQNLDSRHNVLAREIQGVTPLQLLDSGWSELGRVDIVGREKDEFLYAYVNSRAPAWMLRFDGDLDEIRSRSEKALAAYPFLVRTPKEVLSLGSGAGYDTLLALAFGAQHVDAVEINALLVEVAQRWKGYSSRIYDHEGVRLFIEEARNFVRRQTKVYDLINLSLVQTVLPEIYEMSLTESYIYTLEAFKE